VKEGGEELLSIQFGSSSVVMGWYERLDTWGLLDRSVVSLCKPSKCIIRIKQI
jgi:hypothetical protein